MKILTVRQPWAWAIVHGGKDVENRSTNIAGDYRGPVAIHAGKVMDDVGQQDACILAAWPGERRTARSLASRSDWIEVPDRTKFTYGAIIGVVNIVDVHPCHGSATEPIGGCSPWADYSAMQHLVLENPRALATPIPHKGALGMRVLPDDVEAQIRERLEASA